MDRRTFRKLTELVYREAGIKLGPHKHALVCARVGKRLRALGLTGFGEYVKLLERDQTGLEVVELLNAISTNVTQFFREPRHFQVLRQLLRQWEQDGQRRCRIWSAAAATGEEPYSIAITMMETLRESCNAKVLATDLSTRAIERARQGEYEKRHVQQTPLSVLDKYFVKRDDDTGAETYRVTDELRRMVTFGRINLAKQPYPLRGPLDVVFCRNVMIYFDNEVRKRLLAEMFRLLRPGGHLIVGHAESLSGMLSRFKSVEPSVYVRP